MEIFFCDSDATDFLLLNEEESHHLIHVLRKKTGEEIQVINGRGILFDAKIKETGKRDVKLEILKIHKEFGKRNYSFHLAISPTKNSDRFEWLLEKLTEIGIDEITPLLCRHSERKHINEERLNKIILSAAKQSVKAYLPKLNPLQKFDEFISENKSGQKFICTLDAGKNNLLKNKIQKNSDVVVVVGPEGDFRPDEIAYSLKNNFNEVSLGESRLRTETAGLVSCVVVNDFNL